MTKKLKLGMLGAIVMASTMGNAAPSRYYWHIYFTDASMTQEAGEIELTCSGTVYKWGTQTPYKFVVDEGTCPY